MPQLFLAFNDETKDKNSNETAIKEINGRHNCEFQWRAISIFLSSIQTKFETCLHIPIHSSRIIDRIKRFTRFGARIFESVPRQIVRCFEPERAQNDFIM
jgi:hypothetical protein